MSEKFEVGASISHAFAELRRKFWPIVGWTVPPSLILDLGSSSIASMIFSDLEYAVGTDSSFLSENFIATPISFLLFVFCCGIFLSWYGIYRARLGTQVLLGEDMRPREARQRGFNRMLSLLLVSLVIMLAGGVVLRSAAGLAAIFPLGLGGFGILLALAVGIALFVALLYIIVGLNCVMCIMANEGLGFSALGRFWQLAKGNHWKLLQSMVLWMLICVGMILVFLLCVVIKEMLMTASVPLDQLLSFLVFLVPYCIASALNTVMWPSIYLGLLKVEGLKAESRYT